VGFDVLAVGLSMALAGSWTWAAWAYAVVLLIVTAACGGYRPRITLRALEEIPSLITRSGAALILLLVGTALARARIPEAQVLLLGQVPITLIALVAGRLLAYARLRRLRRRKCLSESVLIVGAGRVGSELAALLRDHRDAGLLPVGFVDDLPRGTTSTLPLPLLGSAAELGSLVNRFAIDRVIIAFGRMRESEWVGLLRTAVANGVEIDVVPRFFELGLVRSGDDIDELWGIPLCRVRPPATLTASWRAKRAVDVVTAGTVLALLAPVFPVIALAVRLSSPGPVIYRQRRIGRHGRPFQLLKFRTMRTNHDGEGTWSASGHPDLTLFGRWLRSTSIDELPQLWNILRGDMSLVGPRPERPHFARQFEANVPGYRDRLRLPVGLTGWAQVHGLRGDTSIAERARFDNYYIEHWSLWLDVSILVRTVGVLFRSLFRTSVLPDQLAGRTRSALRWTRPAPAVIEQTDQT
jgi:exopolysaccharide biosynthesis polyprenyl glycosylphosphotransferase